MNLPSESVCLADLLKSIVAREMETGLHRRAGAVLLICAIAGLAWAHSMHHGASLTQALVAGGTVAVGLGLLGARCYGHVALAAMLEDPRGFWRYHGSDPVRLYNAPVLEAPVLWLGSLPLLVIIVMALVLLPVFFPDRERLVQAWGAFPIILLGPSIALLMDAMMWRRHRPELEAKTGIESQLLMVSLGFGWSWLHGWQVTTPAETEEMLQQGLRDPAWSALAMRVATLDGSDLNVVDAVMQDPQACQLLASIAGHRSHGTPDSCDSPLESPEIAAMCHGRCETDKDHDLAAAIIARETEVSRHSRRAASYALAVAASVCTMWVTDSWMALPYVGLMLLFQVPASVMLAHFYQSSMLEEILRDPFVYEASHASGSLGAHPPAISVTNPNFILRDLPAALSFFGIAWLLTHANVAPSPDAVLALIVTSFAGCMLPLWADVIVWSRSGRRSLATQTSIESHQLMLDAGFAWRWPQGWSKRTGSF